MSSGSESSSEEPEVETLVAGRSRRSTAGNRLNNLINLQGDDDDLELLFAEGEEEDFEFEEDDKELASDVQLDSSSDDEDQGPGADQNDLSGETEIQRQEREERKKQRKSKSDFTRMKLPVKKIRPRPTTQDGSEAPAPKKKLDRVSFALAADGGHLRSSSRRQTIRNREIVHQRIKETEKKRQKQLKSMEAAAKQKALTQPKALTQADRMAEAARVERKNSHSLNKWEAEEKKRAEERRAKLAALKNRKLEGPVISWYSGPSLWKDERMVAVGPEKCKDAADRLAKADAQAKKIAEEAAPRADLGPEPAPDSQMGGSQPETQLESQAPAAATEKMEVDPPDSSSTPKPESAAAVDDAMQIDSQAAQSLPVFGPPNRPEIESQGQLREESQKQSALPQGQPDVKPLAATQPPEKPNTIETAVRNLVLLENFDAVGMRSSEIQGHILIKKKPNKLPKAVHETCPITGGQARFRDPKTGIAYANSFAYKKIQNTRAGESRWSDLLGCYVGPTQVAAKGVPKGFCEPPPT